MPSLLSKDDAEKIRRAEIKNLIKKVQDGKSLSVRERKMLDSASEGGGWKDDEELAKQYNCSPSSIRNYRKQGAPLDDPDAFADWVSQRRTGPEGALPATLHDAKLAKLQAEIERIQFANAVEKRLYLVREEVETDMLKIGSAVRYGLQRFMSDAPLWEGLPAAAIERRVREIIDEVAALWHDSTSKLYA